MTPLEALHRYEDPISPIEAILEDARNGRPFILVDAEDRENEGDIVIPAQMATPGVINFMATYGRGLICLALSPERAKQLRLTPMSVVNGTPLGTAFTVSIEAKEGITTGISAHDRARTVAVAIDPSKTVDDIVSPGHVFPLVAREGGVLVRTGHTEAAVDIARLAGLQPAGVICEIMNDDGTMARLPDLVKVAQTHGLKIGTITDLIAFRRRTERYVVKVHESEVDVKGYAGFRLHIYRNSLDGTEHAALVKGQPSAQTEALVRMHQLDLAADVLHVDGPKAGYWQKCLDALAGHDGPGVAVLLRDPDPQALTKRFAEGQSVNHSEKVLRDYGVGAQILLDLGVRRMTLLTASHPKLAALDGYGLEITGWRSV